MDSEGLRTHVDETLTSSPTPATTGDFPPPSSTNGYAERESESFPANINNISLVKPSSESFQNPNEVGCAQTQLEHITRPNEERGAASGTQDAMLTTGLSGFANHVANLRSGFEEDFQTFEQSLKDEPQNSDLLALDWEELNARFRQKMEPKIAEEEALMEQFDTTFQQFMLWMQISSERESERAFKRLRTQMSFVQNSEDKLAERQNHYSQVLQAFQNAMALLQTQA